MKSRIEGNNYKGFKIVCVFVCVRVTRVTTAYKHRTNKTKAKSRVVWSEALIRVLTRLTLFIFH